MGAGLFMAILSVCVPPYFGPSPTDTSYLALLGSRANRMRCAIDCGLLWIFVCALVACSVQDHEGATAAMLRVLPSCVFAFVLGGYHIPTLCLCWHKRRVDVLQASDELTNKTIQLHS
eukprot:COSAG02_NODE_6000_length_3883_cov_1.367336_3_plen_118_part_00